MVAGMGPGGSWSNGTDLSNSQSSHEERRGRCEDLRSIDSVLSAAKVKNSYLTNVLKTCRNCVFFFALLLCYAYMLWVCIDGAFRSCLCADVQDKGRPPVAQAQEKLENRPETLMVGPHDRFVGLSLSENGRCIGNMMIFIITE